MELQLICSNSCLDYQWVHVWGRNDYLAVDFDSNWIEPYAGGIESFPEQFLIKYTQFPMEL